MANDDGRNDSEACFDALGCNTLHAVSAEAANEVGIDNPQITFDEAGLQVLPPASVEALKSVRITEIDYEYDGHSHKVKYRKREDQTVWGRLGVVLAFILALTSLIITLFRPVLSRLF